MEYVEEHQENPQDLPDPNPEDGGDGDEPDDPNDNEPEDNEPGERFLQVMSDLAAGIRTLSHVLNLDLKKLKFGNLIHLMAQICANCETS